MHRIAWIVQPRIIHSRGDDVLHGVAGSRTRNERAHQQSRYGCVAVWEVENVGFFLTALLASRPSPWSRLHTLKSWVPHAPARQCRHGIDTYAIEVMRRGLKD